MKQTITDYKKEAILNKVLRYPEGIMSRRQWLKIMQAKGAFVKEIQEPQIQFSRIKFNRMEWKEQIEYEKKCNEMKTGYRLYISATSSYTITKTEYEAFKDLELSADLLTQQMELTHKIEAGTATEAEIREDEEKEFQFFSKYAN